MNNKVIAIVVGVVVVLGGVYFAMKGDSGSVSDTNSIAVGEQNPATPTENTSGKKMAFSEFMKNGGSYKCTVDQNVQGMTSKGTVYINGSNIRGEFNTSAQGMNVDSNFIMKDGYSYSWSSMMAGQGFKVAVNQNTTGSGAGTSGQYSFNSEQIGDYNCEAWNSDSSKFALPGGVVFTEVKN